MSAGHAWSDPRKGSDFDAWACRGVQNASLSAGEAKGKTAPILWVQNGWQKMKGEALLRIDPSRVLFEPKKRVRVVTLSVGSNTFWDPNGWKWSRRPVGSWRLFLLVAYGHRRKTHLRSSLLGSPGRRTVLSWSAKAGERRFPAAGNSLLQKPWSQKKKSPPCLAQRPLRQLTLAASVAILSAYVQQPRRLCQ